MKFDLGQSWRGAHKQLRELGLIKTCDLVAVAGLVLVTAVMESVGLVMFIPILQFIQNNGNVENLANGSRIWIVITQVYATAGIPIMLVTLMIPMLVLLIARQAVNHAQSIFMGRRRFRMERGLRSAVMAATFQTSPAVIQRLGAGSYVELLDNQCRKAALLVEQFGKGFGLIVLFGAYFLVMLFVAPGATAMALAVAGLAIYLVNRHVPEVRAIAAASVDASRIFGKDALERFQAWRLIKVAETADRETAHMAVRTGRLYDLEMRMIATESRSQLLLVPLLTILTCATLYVSVEHLALSLSTITLFAIMAMRLIPLATNFSRLRHSNELALASMRRLASVLNDMSRNADTPDGSRDFLPLAKGIQYHSVVYTYPGEPAPALRGVDCFFPAGKMTALVGPSGSGKSTMIDLLPRLIDATSGSVLFDGIDSREIRRRSLRHALAYMPQKAVIFDDTASANVRYLKPDAGAAEIEAACRRANAHDFITALPNGYNTVLGEGGARLSGGQQQRIALARVLLSDASIVILDEPTGALDHESESHVRDALRSAALERRITQIVIAHKRTTVENADHVVIIKDGEVSGAGTPSELMRHGQWFHDMAGADS